RQCKETEFREEELHRATSESKVREEIMPGLWSRAARARAAGSSEADSRLRRNSPGVEHDLGRAGELLEVVGLVRLQHDHHVRARHCGVKVGFAGHVATVE